MRVVVHPMANNELQVAMQCARAAGAILRDFYEREYTVRRKENDTPVTDADYAAEQEILPRLRDSFPYSILSEESGASAYGGNGFMWCVDPLDGTRGFIAKTGDFSVVIGLAYRKMPTLGIVYLPITDEMYFAEHGKGAYLQIASEQPVRLHVSSLFDAAGMTAVISSMNTSNEDEMIVARMGIGRMIRAGSTAKRICLVARGECDLYVNASKKTAEWDTCAPQIILQEAGGTITDLRGFPMQYCQENVMREHGVFASNGIRHAELVSLGLGNKLRL